MHCGVMVTGYNQGDWERLLRGDYNRPPTVSDAANMDDTLYMGELVEPLGFDSIWATEHYGSAYSMQPNPLQYLAYWAGRTTRVDMGTAVIVGPVVESRAAGPRDLHARHPAEGPSSPPGDWSRHRASRVRLARLPDGAVAQVLLRRGQCPQGGRRCRALHLRWGDLQDSTDHHPSTGPPQGRTHHGGSRRRSPPRPPRNWRPRTAWGKCSSPATTSTR